MLDEGDVFPVVPHLTRKSTHDSYSRVPEQYCMYVTVFVYLLYVNQDNLHIYCM